MIVSLIVSHVCGRGVLGLWNMLAHSRDQKDRDALVILMFLCHWPISGSRSVHKLYLQSRIYQCASPLQYFDEMQMFHQILEASGIQKEIKAF